MLEKITFITVWEFSTQNGNFGTRAWEYLSDRVRNTGWLSFALSGHLPSRRSLGNEAGSPLLFDTTRMPKVCTEPVTSLLVPSRAHGPQLLAISSVLHSASTSVYLTARCRSLLPSTVIWWVRKMSADSLCDVRIDCVLRDWCHFTGVVHYYFCLAVSYSVDSGA